MDEKELTTESDLWIEKEKVCDQRTFVAFLKVLSEEEGETQKLLSKNPEKYKYSSVLGWENGGISNYLDAIAACLEDGEWFKHSTKLDWKELAEIFYMGKIYE